MSRTAAPTLVYAKPSLSALSPSSWRVLLWVGVGHLVAVVVLLAVGLRGVLNAVAFVRTLPTHNWFVAGLFVSMLTTPVIVLMNVLAVAGYAAGARGRSPRRWFVIYAPVQAALMLIQSLVTAGMALAGTYTPPGTTTTVGVKPLGLLLLPLVYAVLGLPLFLLLFRRIRRGCFAT